MTESETDKFDAPQEAMVREYLSYQLDGQVGRAEARFRQFLAEPTAAAKRSGILHMPAGRMRWSLGLVGAALAASLAALWAGPSLQPTIPPAPGVVAPSTGGGATASNNPVLVQQDLQSQTFDDGTAMIDNTPVRVLRRRDLERTRWFDQNQKLQGEQVVPQDHVVYVKMKTY